MGMCFGSSLLALLIPSNHAWWPLKCEWFNPLSLSLSLSLARSLARSLSNHNHHHHLNLWRNHEEEVTLLFCNDSSSYGEFGFCNKQGFGTRYLFFLTPTLEVPLFILWSHDMFKHPSKCFPLSFQLNLHSFHFCNTPTLEFFTLPWCFQFLSKIFKLFFIWSYDMSKDPSKCFPPSFQLNLHSFHFCNTSHWSFYSHLMLPISVQKLPFWTLALPA